MDLFPIHEAPSKTPINVRRTSAGMGPSDPIQIGGWMGIFFQGDGGSCVVARAQ